MYQEVKPTAKVGKSNGRGQSQCNCSNKLPEYEDYELPLDI